MESRFQRGSFFFFFQRQLSCEFAARDWTSVLYEGGGSCVASYAHPCNRLSTLFLLFLLFFSLSFNVVFVLVFVVVGHRCIVVLLFLHLSIYLCVFVCLVFFTPASICRVVAVLPFHNPILSSPPS